MTIADMGAYLRREAAEKGYGTLQAGSLFVRVTRHGADWALELCDEQPTWQIVRDEWATAVGIPDYPASGDWRFESDGKVARCSWTGTEDAAAEGTPVFRMGGAK